MATRDTLPASPSLLAAAAFIVVVAGLVVGPGTGGPGNLRDTDADVGAAAGAPASEGRGPATASRNDPGRAFQEFWEFAKDADGKELAAELRDHTEIEPEFLIATVPDPIDSRFGYRFDSVVDDIQMAIESQGWNLDRYWLPWWPAGDQPRQRDAIKPVYEPAPEPAKGFALVWPERGLPFFSGRPGEPVRGAAAPAPNSALHEREPGVLLFRKHRYSKDGRRDPDPRQRLLAVFLVGERPTSGVSKVALGKALNVIDRVRGGVGQRVAWALGASGLDLMFGPAVFAAPIASGFDLVFGVAVFNPTVFAALGASACDAVYGPTEFDIVGPFFTGSERSLSAVIADWTAQRLKQFRPPGARSAGDPRHLRWRFNVRPGSSNQIDVVQFLKDSGHDPKGPVEVKFNATLYPFNRILDELFGFLLRQNGGWTLGKVALLSESDTEFGNKIDFRRWEKQLGTKITQMRYPFHVSQLAVAIDRSRQSDPPSPVPTLARSSSRLRIPFDETGSPRDVVPSLSPRMTAASDEFDLAKILETISTEDFRYVGIVASDTRDAIFLSGLIREYCPDVQMFMTAGDLLLGHPDYTGQLRGTVVASPYPLFSMAQRWDPPHEGDRRRHMFMHESDQGYFNATVSIIGRRENDRLEKYATEEDQKANKFYRSMYDYGRPFDEMDLVESPRKQPEFPRDFLPSIWLGVIGERGIWPVEFRMPKLEDVERDKFLFTLKADEQPEPEKDDAIPEKLVPLIPQFSWIWGALALGLSALAWWTFRAHWRLALDIVRPGGLSDKLRIMPPVEGERSPLWLSQEGFVAAGLVILAVLYGYFVAHPCRLTLAHSPWRYFLFRIPTGRWPFPWGDFWNWQFGLMAIVFCGASFASLAAAAGLRLSLAYRDAEEPGRAANKLAIVGVAVVGLLGILSGPARHMGLLAIVSCIVLTAAAAPVYSGVAWVARRRFDVRRLAFIPALIASLALAVGLFANPPYNPGHTTGLFEVLAAFTVQVADAVFLGLTVAWILRLTERADPVARAVREARVALEKSERELKQLGLHHPPAAPDVSRAGEQVKAAGGRKEDLEQSLNRHTRFATLVVPLVAGVSIAFAEIALTGPRPPYDSLLYLERALILGNGVTPLVPALLLGAIAVAWVSGQLRRVDYLDRFWRDPIARPKLRPLELSIDEYPGLEAVKRRKMRLGEAGQEVRALLNSPVPGALFKSPGSLAALGLTVLFAMRLYERFIPTVDGIAFSRAIVVTFGFLTLTVVLSLCRLVLVWSAIRRLLREFAQIPMQRAFDRVPRSVSRQFGPYLNALPPRLQNMEVHVRQWAMVARDYDDDAVGRSLFGDSRDDKRAALDLLAGEIRGGHLETPSGGDGDAASERIMRTFEVECADPVRSVQLSQSRVRTGVRRATAACLTVLIPYWTTRTLDEGYGETPKEKGDGATKKPAVEDGATKKPAVEDGALIKTEVKAGAPKRPRGKSGAPIKTQVAAVAAEREAAAPDVRPTRLAAYEDERFVRWLEQAEDLVVLEMVHFLSECMIHLKNLTVFLTFSPLLLLLAAASYPFQPGQFLITCLWALLCVVGVSVVTVYIQMERNELLSRVSKTSPDHITFNWTFVTQVTAVAVPLVASALTRFPFFSDTFNQWLDPIFRVLK
jgi:hypothetical protein